MLVKLMRRIYKNQKGITGLETAIILIAFVVVAAVFAYTVLSAGLFSSQKSSEAVYSGLKETRSTLELKGGVVTKGMSMIDDCETVWTADVGAVVLETDPVIEHDNSLQITTATGANIQAHHAVPATGTWDLSGCTSVSFWIITGSDVSALGGSAIVLDLCTDTAGAVPGETLAIAAANLDGTWHHVTVNLSGTTANYNAVASIAVRTTATWVSTETVNIDCIETQAFQDIDQQPVSYADSVQFTLVNALNGESIDFTDTTDICDTTADTEGDGNLNDQTSQLHKVIINYGDQFQYLENLAWTATPIGHADTDELLDAGEQFLITVDLSYVNSTEDSNDDTNKVTAGRTFTIEIKPPTGAVMVLEKTMPDIVSQVDGLN
ncbi:MAG: hypothetical protein PHV74_03210 [Dehalococcoidia bacterium]|nr:hypothetical protein [Dehalococcoidia bacterium]